MVRLRDINNVEIAVLENAYNVGYSLSGKELWTAHFSLPNDDPKLPLVTHYHYVEIEDIDGEYVGLFRILPSQTEVNGTVGSTTYTCYHVFHTLTDSAYFGELIKIDEPTSDVIEAILAAQKIQNWVFGSSEASELVSLYINHSNGLVDPMYNLLENMTGDYVYSFNTRVYPWVVSLVRIPDTPVCRIKEGYNMHGFDILSEPSNAINRVYPICFDDEQNQITIESVNSGKLYLEDAALVAAHGPIEYIYEYDEWVDPLVLKEIGQTVLDSAKEIKVTWNCSASDLVKLVEEPLFVIDRLRVNTLVRVETSDFGDLNMVIRKVTKRDMYGSPEDLELELDAGNAVPTFDMSHVQRQITRTNRRITSTAKSVLAKGREIATDLINSGHGGHVRVYPNYILIMDTDDEATATNVWQYNLNGVGHSSTGILGPYNYAWTMDGAFNTDFIIANSINVNHLASDIGQVLNIQSNEAIVNKVERVDMDLAIEDAKTAIGESLGLQMTQTWDALRLDFLTPLEERLQDQIDDNGESLDDIRKYIRFENGNIVLGVEGNELILTIKNDRISFIQGGVELAWFSDSQLSVTHLEAKTSLTMGSFAWLPRTNGNLSLVKVV